jgi:hypothetical protein
LPSSYPESLGRIGTFEVLGHVGRGGMGLVLRAFDVSLQRTAAIKVMHSHLAAYEQNRRRFQREARTAARINHPNVVIIHGVNEQQGTPYLVMELLVGVTLAERIRRGPPFDAQALFRIGGQLAAGLDAAHQRGIIHRDIKPQNVMLVGEREEVKITDFGLAMPVVDGTRVTEDGQQVGTPAYMSPEQITGGQLDPRSDLFGLGCVLYAMAVGQSPFADEHRFDIPRKIREFVPRPLREVRPDLPGLFSDVVERLLAKDPGSRIQSAREVLEVLSGAAPLPVGRPRGRRGLFPGRRLRWSAVAVALVLVFLLVTASAWWFGGRAPGPHGPVTSGLPNQVLTVARSGNASAQSIGDALALAGPNARIRILDGSTYKETLLIDDPERLSGLTIESDQGATLVAHEATVTAVLVKGTPGVSLRGLRIKAGDKQHCVMIEGESPGLALKGVRFYHSEKSPFACVVARHGARGAEERPIRLSDCEIEGGELGVVLEDLANGRVQFFQIENCRFRGPGMHVVLCGDVSDVGILGNIFSGGTGIGMNMGSGKQAGQVRHVRIGCNTFFQTSRWMCLHGSGRRDQEVAVFNNLILQAGTIEAPQWGLEQLARNWTFRNNWWEARPRDLPANLAVLRPVVPLLSRRPSDPDFLRPPPGSPLGTSGAGGDFPAHIGALLPAQPSGPH